MIPAAIGRSLELYYLDGRPDGMLTGKMFNWSGQVLVVPRTQLADALVRKEAGFAGVYLLLGEHDGEPLAYVGESEVVGNRIRSHDVEKDWWSVAILVTTTANELNKAHVRYLEARLIQDATRIGRTPLANGTAPPRPPLSEADIGKMEAFLDTLFLVLPAVRVDLFVERARPNARVGQGVSSASSGPRFVLVNKRHNLRATAVVRDGEFIVEAGSLTRPSWEGIGADGQKQIYEELRRAGVIQISGEHGVFTQNYAFKSPSAAAAVVTGRSANGTVEWKTETGQTYKEWERETLTEPV